MKKWPPIAFPGPGGTHVNADMSLGQRGSWPDGSGYQQIIDEICAAISKSGMTLDGADSAQLARAIRSQMLNYRGASGTANALTVELDPVPDSNATTTGMPLRIKPSATNTGAATLSVNGLPALPIVRQGGGALIAGDLSASTITTLIGTGASWQMVGASPSEAGRLINIQIFTTSGTYTPTPGMTFALFEGCGGGGGGAGANNPAAGTVSLGSPGGGATSGKARFTAAEIGASKPVTIGAAGASAAAANGGAGGATSLGTLLILPGGEPGLMFNGTTAPAANGNGSVSAAATGANISQRQGSTPGYAQAQSATSAGIFCGPGGDTPYGASRGTAANNNGSAAVGYGSGGGGVAIASGGGPAVGGAARPGILIILEYGA